jgi:hypothetical protein
MQATIVADAHTSAAVVAAPRRPMYLSGCRMASSSSGTEAKWLAQPMAARSRSVARALEARLARSLERPWRPSKGDAEMRHLAVVLSLGSCALFACNTNRDASGFNYDSGVSAPAPRADDQRGRTNLQPDDLMDKSDMSGVRDSMDNGASGPPTGGAGVGNANGSSGTNGTSGAGNAGVTNTQGSGTNGGTLAPGGAPTSTTGTPPPSGAPSPTTTGTATPYPANPTTTSTTTPSPTTTTTTPVSPLSPPMGSATSTGTTNPSPSPGGTTRP